MTIFKFKNLILGGLISLLAWGTSQAQVVGKSIATVNGEAIFLSEFEQNWDTFEEQALRARPGEKLTPEVIKTQKKLLLDQMIEEKILLQEAQKRKIKVPRRQLEEGILHVKNRFKILPPGQKPTEEDISRALTDEEKKGFLEELKKQKLTEKEFEKKIEGQLQVLRLTEEEVRTRIDPPFDRNKNGSKPEERELTKEYDKESQKLYAEIEKKFNQSKFKPDPEDDIDQMVVLLKGKLGETVRARHILVKSSREDDFKKRSIALKKIKEIKKDLDEGADFEATARKVSEGPSAPNGGDLGYFTRGQMVPEFEKAAFSLGVGDMSDIVETQFGYHIILLEEKKAAKKLRYEDIKFDLAGYLYEKKGEIRYQEFVKELRDKSDVKIRYEFDSVKG